MWTGSQHLTCRVVDQSKVLALDLVKPVFDFQLCPLWTSPIISPQASASSSAKGRGEAPLHGIGGKTRWDPARYIQAQGTSAINDDSSDDEDAGEKERTS